MLCCLMLPSWPSPGNMAKIPLSRVGWGRGDNSPNSPGTNNALGISLLQSSGCCVWASVWAPQAGWATGIPPVPVERQCGLCFLINYIDRWGGRTKYTHTHIYPSYGSFCPRSCQLQSTFCSHPQAGQMGISGLERAHELLAYV